MIPPIVHPSTLVDLASSPRRSASPSPALYRPLRALAVRTPKAAGHSASGLFNDRLHLPQLSLKKCVPGALQLRGHFGSLRLGTSANHAIRNAAIAPTDYVHHMAGAASCARL
jgi:hypothetical protein